MPDSALTILHVDMDAFYASIEQRDDPALRGRPVIVGGLGPRGVVSAASYEARPFGVHSAMPMTAARRRCPQGVFLSARMQHYAEIARQIRAILLSFTPLVEPLSLDEAFLDVRGCEGLFGSALDIARTIKGRIRSEVGLVASVGVAPNKFLSKLASDLGKPDGLVVVPTERVTAFLEPLPVGRLWGIGAKGERRLHALGIQTIGQLAALPEHVLADQFGESGCHLWQLAHGRDERKVVPDRDAKSLSTETTFAQDVGYRTVLRAWLLELVDHLGGRLRHEGLCARTVEVKVRSTAFQTRIRSVSLAEATQATEVLWQAARTLLERCVTPDMLPVRLIGVAASNLTRTGTTQGHLFEEATRKKHQALDRTVDAIRRQLGRAAIQRGSRLDRGREPDC